MRIKLMDNFLKVQNARINLGQVEDINLQYFKNFNVKKLATSSYLSNLESTDKKIIQTSKIRYLVFNKLEIGIGKNSNFFLTQFYKRAIIDIIKKVKSKKTKSIPTQ